MVRTEFAVLESVLAGMVLSHYDTKTLPRLWGWAAMHEKVIALSDPQIGLKGFIALHTLKFGPAFGGIRIIPYSSLEECRKDALRLSEAMTYKCLINDIPGGGGKAVLMRDEIKDREAVLRVLGDQVNALAGSFYTGPDSGVSRSDLDVVASRTNYVSREDLAPATAEGLLCSIRAACTFTGMLLKGLRVAIQGLGDVGFEVARNLLNAGAEVVGCDIDPDAAGKAEALGVEIVPPGAMLSTPCDLFCPCALGEILTPEAVGRLKCRMVIGAANNMLSDDGVAEMLSKRDILYVPDFVTNSGGAIKGTLRYLSGAVVDHNKIATLYTKTLALLEKAEAGGVTPLRVAMDIVTEKLNK